EAQASYTPWRADDNENHYDLFTAGGLDFIAVHLGYDVTQEELEWASEVLDEYSDRNAMVMTHAHRRPSTEPDGRGAAFSHDRFTSRPRRAATTRQRLFGVIRSRTRGGY